MTIIARYILAWLIANVVLLALKQIARIAQYVWSKFPYRVSVTRKATSL